MRATLAMVAFAWLAGCGFHLRGSSVHSDVESVYVSAADGVDVEPALVRALDQSRVKVLDERAGAAVAIDLLEQQRNRRAVSYTERATTAEYMVEFSVRFRITGANEQPLIGDRWARATRTYQVDTNNLVGSNQQQTLVESECATDVVQQILRSLNAATRPGRS